MKKIVLILLVLTLFSSCSKEVINNDSPTNYSVDTTIDTQSPYNTFQNVITLNHKISHLLNGSDYFEVNKKVEKALNLINSRDKDGLISEFSQSTKDIEDLDIQTNILFDYIDNPIIDYIESEPSVSEYVSYGKTIQKEFHVLIYFYTANSKYSLDLVMVTIDEINSNNIGLKSMCVLSEEVEQYYLDNYDVNDFPSKMVTSGLTCFSKDGLITR